MLYQIPVKDDISTETLAGDGGSAGIGDGGTRV